MPGRDGTGPLGGGPLTGRGLGLACRRGFGRGFGRGFAFNQTSSKTQKELLNEQKTQFNLALGLCVGHDSMFYKYSDALMTTLVAKDVVTGHNPAAAIYCAEGYFKKRIL